MSELIQNNIEIYYTSKLRDPTVLIYKHIRKK
jgi:hypothetical protein